MCVSPRARRPTSSIPNEAWPGIFGQTWKHLAIAPVVVWSAICPLDLPVEGPPTTEPATACFTAGSDVRVSASEIAAMSNNLPGRTAADGRADVEAPTRSRGGSGSATCPADPEQSGQVLWGCDQWLAYTEQGVAGFLTPAARP